MRRRDLLIRAAASVVAFALAPLTTGGQQARRYITTATYDMSLPKWPRYLRIRWTSTADGGFVESGRQVSDDGIVWSEWR